ncbi:hypothetical protein CTEN210_02005 [Chaetoceros tenuissimus]|uniref:Ubiquitin-like protease family profile domain-containing protein n=1 Tax=Chaetoceros tenuissimus TaxID=426638 RepID=A0AAD3CIL7_9STRA|nr:hypothetical protein CTEN210_02005 [Chaetoceros tenuissimus]
MRNIVKRYNKNIDEKQWTAIDVFTTYFSHSLANVYARLPSKANRLSILGNIFHLSKLYMPWNVHDCHWVLIEVDMKWKRIRLYDSFKDNGENNYGECIDNLKKYLKDEAVEMNMPWMSDEWQYEKIRDCPIQTNIYDCGVHVCANFELLMMNQKLEYTTEEITKYRYQMAHRIRTGEYE